MSGLTLTIIKLGFLALLWLFVLSAVSVIRSDLFGVRSGRGAAQAAGRQPRMQKPPKPPRASKRGRGDPTTAVIVRGANTGARASLAGGMITIGRGADCELPIDDEYVSTRHAAIRKHGNDWYAEDLGSTNGTFVDEQRIHGPTPIRKGGTVRIGKTVIELRK